MFLLFQLVIVIIKHNGIYCISILGPWIMYLDIKIYQKQSWPIPLYENALVVWNKQDYNREITIVAVQLLDIPCSITVWICLLGIWLSLNVWGHTSTGECCFQCRVFTWQIWLRDTLLLNSNNVMIWKGTSTVHVMRIWCIQQYTAIKILNQFLLNLVLVRFSEDNN